MLDAFIIDALRRQKEQEEDEQRPRVELPVPPPDFPTIREEPAEKRVIIIEM